MKNKVSTESHDFLLKFALIEAVYGFTYSILFIYLNAVFTGLVFLTVTILVYPTIVYLSKNMHERAARFLFIVGGLIYVYTSIITVKFDLRADLYYLPVMMVPLLIFKTHQKKEIAIGMTLPFIAWIMGLKEITPSLPEAWLPKSFPHEVFSHINFVGAFLLSAIFLNFHRKHLILLNEIMSHDYEEVKIIRDRLSKSQKLAKVGSWELDLLTNKIFWSDEVFEMFELSKNHSDLSYDFFLSVIHPDDRDVVNSAYLNSLKNRTAYEIVHRLLMPDGRIKFVREQCETHYDEDLKPIYSNGTIQDITESQKNDALLHHSSKMASLGEMAGGIAHEINNPLTIIMGKSQLLLRKVKMEEFNKDYFTSELNKIVNNVERISKIVKGMRAISRNADLDPLVSCGVQKIIEEVCDLSLERFKHGSVELIVDIKLDTQIMCRPSEINQVILNLINNSFDAVVDLEEKWVEIKVIVSEIDVKIKVTDSGKGISEQILDKLMYPFFTTKEVGKGTGLGLSISKQIIEKHNGKLFYDKESKNTSFVLEIPRVVISELSEKACA